MKPTEPYGLCEPAVSSASGTPPVVYPTRVYPGSMKIQAVHVTKLAMVYVRQSTPQQVLGNRESTARQYALADYARVLGWPSDRVVIVDEDQGQSGASAAHRAGFQQLLAEVTLDHVGLILGLEMSRLARSSKDWHHLLEVCALFGTLLADQDGVYDACDPNDRLLLGLKGTMSEVELHTMRQRLDRGRFNKARRGELFHGVPMGYVRLHTGEVAFDPDEQARAVVALIFDKFDELGSIYGLFHDLVSHGMALPIRARTGAQKGQLQWRRPSLATLCQMLHHPIYAGAYVYGRRPVDAKGRYGNGHRRRANWLPMEAWKVLMPDRLPAYITWQRYLSNQERLKQNRSGPDTRGTPRQGCALLGGLVICGTCGRSLQVSYQTQKRAYYGCVRHLMEATERTCYGVQAHVIDTVVVEQVLRALEPAALELSLAAQHRIEHQRQRLDKHWQQRLQRVRYEVEVAERRYQAVDPDNRLVAASLEKSWEEALRQQRHLQEDYDRFVRDTPPTLREDEVARIRELAGDIATLWQAAGTTNAHRQEMIRCLVERVVVQVQRDEYVTVAIHWAGGHLSHHEVIRPVKTYDQLRDVEQLHKRVVTLRQAGNTMGQIAAQLNAEGFVPPKRCRPFSKELVRKLLLRQGLGDERCDPQILGPHEWWLWALARELKMPGTKLRDWAVRHWVHARKSASQGLWIVWADADEMARLQQLLRHSQRGANGYPEAFTRPKKRPLTSPGGQGG